MPNTGLDVFDHTVQRTNQILGQIEESLGWTKEQRNQSYLALRVVLHALRDRLPVDDAANFSAQMPMLLKGVFFDGWDPAKVPEKYDRDQFIERVREDFQFSVGGGIDAVIRAVMEALFDVIDAGEAAKVLNNLPTDLADYLAGMEAGL